MNGEEYLRKFTAKDLDNFDQVQSNALSKELLAESVDYVAFEIYRFKNYAIEKILRKSKKGSSLARGNIEELRNCEDLSIEDRIYAAKLINLRARLSERLQLKSDPKLFSIKNIMDYQEEDSLYTDEENKKKYIVFLAEKGKAELLAGEWIKNKFIDGLETQDVLSIFCDYNGKRFSNLDFERIRWNGNNRELGYFIRMMLQPNTKLLSDHEIWMKVSNFFLDRNGNKINPNNISVASQSIPKGKQLIEKIVNKVKSSNFN